MIGTLCNIWKKSSKVAVLGKISVIIIDKKTYDYDLSFNKLIIYLLSMDDEIEKLVQNKEDNESVSGRNDEMECLKACKKRKREANSEDLPITNFSNLDIIKLKNTSLIGPTLVDTLDIDNLLNINKIFFKSHVILDVTSSKTFCELAPGTDLNVPPANWLYPSVNLPNPINIKQKNEESASFYIANMFPECNNKVSIVADAEVIKKLFKIPYNKESVSLMVRKIGNILLIDNFDIANFSGNEEITKENNLNQVEEFITKLKELNTNLRKANNSNKKLRQRNMFLKFLFRSVTDDTVMVNEASDDLTSANLLPDHSEEAGRVHKFSRIINWTFEETQMLIGTNKWKQYIFGSGATRKKCSLHLFKAGKPLKITSAIDIWLDNLMCDIPEAVICFHLDGIVKHYEYIQTQNIPHLMGSQFSITKIKASVQGIVSFLLNHELQRSQIYWLLKGKNENDFKFFNLNMMEATDGEIQIIKTQFDFECGKLFYRFGHNQFYSNTEMDGKEWNNTMLLEVSIRTLSRKIHPEIIATSNYLIVHLSISYEIFKTFLFVKSKDQFQNCKKQPESVTKRCFDALTNISDGLKCLPYFCESTNTNRKIPEKSTTSNNSFKFNFKFKKTQKQDEVKYINISSLFPKKEYRVLEVLPTWQDVNEDRDYWKNYLKFLFYQKAELVFGILAQEYFYCDMFELCLISLDMMVRCNKIKIKIDPSSHSIAINPVIIMAGDCCQLFVFENVWENSKACSADDNNLRKLENILITDEQYYEINTNVNYGLQVNLKGYSKIELMKKAIEFYKKSLEYEEMDFIRKKLFGCNLTLSKYYCDNARSLDYFEESKKYLNEAYDNTACLPLYRAVALFHRAEVHDHLYINIYIDEIVTHKNSLLIECLNDFLESFNDALLILRTYNGDKIVCKILELNQNFGNFINSITSKISVWRNDNNSKISAELRFMMYGCFMSGLKKILKECLSYKRKFDNNYVYLTKAVMFWCIGCSAIEMKKLKITLFNTKDIILYLNSAIEGFSRLYAWRYYLLALYDQSTCLMDKTLNTDDSNVPLLQKIKTIKSILLMFCIASKNFRILIDNNFEDNWIPANNTDDELFNKIYTFQNQIKNLLNRGLELLATYSEENPEIDTFKKCLLVFEDDINRDMDIRLFLIAITPKIKTMGKIMEFI